MSFKVMVVNIKRVVLGDVTQCGLRQAYQRCGATLHPPPIYRATFEGSAYPQVSGFHSVYVEVSDRSVKRG